MLPDGIYRIACYSNPRYGLDVAGGGTVNYTNVQIWEYDGVPQLKFEVKYISSGSYAGSYTIRALHTTNSNIDIEYPNRNWNNPIKSGCNVMLYVSDGTEPQAWNIEKSGDAFVIRSHIKGWNASKQQYSDDLYLNVYGGTPENGKNVQVHTDAHKWYFIPVEIAEGCYSIESYKVKTKVIGVENGGRGNGAKTILHTFNNNLKEMWYVRPQLNGYYSIVAAHSGKSLDVPGGTTKDGDQLHQWSILTNANQQWTIRKSPDGTAYNIVANNGKYVDLSGGGETDGTHIQIWSGDANHPNQKWIFSKATPNGPAKVGDKSFPSVNEAIKYADANGGTVTLHDWTNIEDDNTFNKICTPANNVTVDLNGWGFDVNGTASDAVVGDGKVTILLKDNGELRYANGSKVTGSPVRFERTFASATRAGNWQALYLPINANTDAYDVGSVIAVNTQAGQAKLTLRKQLDVTKQIEAYTSYFIRSKAGTVTLTAKDNTLLPRQDKDAVGLGNGYTQQGCLVDLDNNSTNPFWVLTNGGVFTRANATAHQRPYHWVINPPAGGGISAFSIFEDEEEETSIEGIEVVEESNEPTYTVGGVRVNSTNLTPGIYIRGGKKFVVR